MIRYDRGGVNHVLNLFRVRGSVFPKALCFSIPSAIITAVLTIIINDLKLVPQFEGEDFVMHDNAIWAGFHFLLGFLVVFRTSQAYARFWEGCTAACEMGAEWFNCCASLMAFSKFQATDGEKVLRFQNILIRLFSMLHAAALGEIEDVPGKSNVEDVAAFQMELIDAEGIDEVSLRVIRDSDCKAELIFQWIQSLVVEQMNNGVLRIPAPILTRSFQEIARGMVHYHDARRISKIPFPFPYAVTCDCLLVMHWVLAPFVVSQWCPKIQWAAAFSFIQVFTLWALNFIAVELENPFGSDPNDMDGKHMQAEMNNNLRMLMHKSTLQTPSLRCDGEEGFSQQEFVRRVIREKIDRKRSFMQMWEVMPEECCMNKRVSTPDSPLRTGCERSDTWGGTETTSTKLGSPWEPSGCLDDGGIPSERYFSEKVGAGLHISASQVWEVYCRQDLTIGGQERRCMRSIPEQGLSEDPHLHSDQVDSGKVAVVEQPRVTLVDQQRVSAVDDGNGGPSWLYNPTHCQDGDEAERQSRWQKLYALEREKLPTSGEKLSF